ncbi:MAG TPA: AAA family ATPase [Candidatus Acidoferrum sp.]|nr:AAA family ATPase [Candidatus Acidoferrum sp.]
MYEKFFGLSENPFRINPDPRYAFMTLSAREALAGMTYGIQTRKGIIVLTGEVGTGKTTLLNMLMQLLRKQRAATAFVFNTQLSVNDLLDYMMADFGIQCESHSKGQMLMRLNRWLLDRHYAGEPVVLVVDEAQNLSPQLLEEIRLLTNMETSTEKLLQIVLSGQLELEIKLRHPLLRQLRQRVTLHCRTSRLSMEETRGYIAQRLRVAGANGKELFSSEAIERVHMYACGIPRLVNVLCDHALIIAFADNRAPILPHVVDEVAREFGVSAGEPEGSDAMFQGNSLETDALLQDLVKSWSRGRQSSPVNLEPKVRTV